MLRRWARFINEVIEDGKDNTALLVGLAALMLCILMTGGYLTHRTQPLIILFASINAINAAHHFVAFWKETAINRKLRAQRKRKDHS